MDNNVDKYWRYAGHVLRYYENGMFFGNITMGDDMIVATRFPIADDFPQARELFLCAQGIWDAIQWVEAVHNG
ncbi:MAG: hypothetical protein WC962_09590 [Phycisphaerae bacterium]